MRVKRAVQATASVAAVVGLVTLLPSASPAASSPPTSTPPASSGLLASSRPKTVVLNPANGDVVSVTAGEPASVSSQGASPDISNHNICNSGDGCYFSGRVPYANQGFYGSPGTYHGGWPYRSAYDTGRYTAYACWRYACSQYWFGPNTYVSFNGTLVYGTAFGIN